MNDPAEWIYGRHAAAAALANGARRIERLLLTKNAADRLGPLGPLAAKAEIVAPKTLDAALPAGAVHQGAAVLASPLPPRALDEICAPPRIGARLIVLDQITDPQNIGAAFRAGAAFGARALICQERKTPPFAGALAKAAAGAVESLPAARVVNIARALEELKDTGYFLIGLAGEAASEIGDAPADRPIALVLGAEGAGLRRLTRESCDLLARIPISETVESLNVSTAAAVALYALRARS